MTYLIDRIRMWMCKHEWSKESFTLHVWDRDKRVAQIRAENVWLMCTKCGYSKKVKI